uniref:Uncharacterized protein n=1 Tax=Anguilla anguilla TaxID=7936 RepID=A0A0E9PLW4_ANGAN
MKKLLNHSTAAAWRIIRN